MRYRVPPTLRRLKQIYTIFKDSVRRSQRTHRACIGRTSRWSLCREITVAYSKNHNWKYEHSVWAKRSVWCLTWLYIKEPLGLKELNSTH